MIRLSSHDYSLDLPKLAQTFKRIGELTDAQALAVFNFYKRNHILKFDASSGYTVRHGGFLDADVLRRAARIALEVRK